MDGRSVTVLPSRMGAGVVLRELSAARASSSAGCSTLIAFDSVGFACNLFVPSSVDAAASCAGRSASVCLGRKNDFSVWRNFGVVNWLGGGGGVAGGGGLIESCSL